MAKAKIFLLILITILGTIFIYENSIPAPPIKLFGSTVISSTYFYYNSYFLLFRFNLWVARPR